MVKDGYSSSLTDLRAMRDVTCHMDHTVLPRGGSGTRQMGEANGGHNSS